jgi:hypothetical protein
MKTAVLFLSGLVLSAFFSGPASAEAVRVRLTARVTEVSDSGNVLAGKVVLGQRVTGLYVYNTNTPNQSPDPQWGDYQPYANEGRVRFAIGSLAFESNQPTQGIRIQVRPEQGGGSGQFIVASNDNKPLASGATVDFLWLELRGQGNVTQSVALPSAAPVLTQYFIKEAMINGSSPSGGYNIRVQIEAAERIVPDAMVVSPASGTFAANQRFDAAVILPRNSVVQNAHAMANGQLLPLTYPGSCQLQPQVGTGRPSLLCLGADAVMGIEPGAPIEWTVELTNGTIYTETVNWERAP